MVDYTPGVSPALDLEAFQTAVVREMVAQFCEQVEWCSCLKDSGSRVCDLVPGPADNRV
jgi:hypothetical protein